MINLYGVESLHFSLQKLGLDYEDRCVCVLYTTINVILRNRKRKTTGAGCKSKDASYTQQNNCVEPTNNTPENSGSYFCVHTKCTVIKKQSFTMYAYAVVMLLISYKICEFWTMSSRMGGREVERACVEREKSIKEITAIICNKPLPSFLPFCDSLLLAVVVVDVVIVGEQTVGKKPWKAFPCHRCGLKPAKCKQFNSSQLKEAFTTVRA